MTRRHSGLVAAAVVAVTSIVASVATASELNLGEGVSAFAWAFVGPALYTGVGVVILWRRPGHGVGRLALLMGLALSVSGLLRTLLAVAPIWAQVQMAIGSPIGVALEIALVLSEALPSMGIVAGSILLILWFPDGRRTSRLGLVAQTCLAISAITLGLSSVGLAPFDGLSSAGFPALLLTYGLAVVDLVRRYRRADSVRRVQMRWLLASVLLSVATLVAVILFGEYADWIWDVWLGSVMLPAPAIAIAITRYHLYDIDRIVSRSISYLLVTAVLFATFSVVNLAVSTSITVFITEEARAVGVAISTLVVATLFQPVRGRVQRIVDRRFHRSRYDAERTVAAFAGRLRDQLDLPTLTLEMQRATVDAVDPDATGVWLRSGAPR